MTERWRQVDKLFHAALEQEPGRRALFLDRACADDPSLKKEVEALIRSHEEAGSFLGPPPSNSLVGKNLGPYHVKTRLGSGGMGEVYLAEDTRLGRKVAVKTLAPALLSDTQFRARFMREARSVSSLNHPHICTLHDIGQQDGVDYLVMEYLEGESLADRLKRGRLPLDQALRYAAEIASALDKAHRHGITHRDLKPANIMLTKSGAKLLDFGLAKTKPRPEELTEARSLTESGMILGTLQYMAPEQVEGKETDARTDIFSFGAVLYEMVTGQKAFQGTSQASLMAAILEHEPAPILPLEPTTPGALDHLIRGCLAKDPDDRWQTAHDITKQLRWIAGTRSAIEDRSAEQHSGEAPDTVMRSSPRWMLFAITALGAMVIALASLLVLSSRTAPAAGSPAARAYIDLTPAEGLANNGRPILTSMAFSPDGQTVVYAAVKDNVPRLYRRPLDQLTAIPMDGTDGGVNPFFSPDGRSVGFFAAGKLKKVPLNGGPVAEICNLPNLVGATWTADNTIIFGGVSLVLNQVSADGGKPQPLTTIDKSRHEWGHGLPRVLPNGKGIIFTIGKSGHWEDADVAVYVFATHQVRILLPNGAADARYVSTGHLIYMRAGKLMAVPFDQSAMQVTGSPVALIDDVMQSVHMANTGSETFSGQFDVSPAGTLLYATGGTFPLQKGRLVWLDRRGQASPPVNLDVNSYPAPRLSPDGQRIALSVFTQNDRADLWVYDIARQTSLRLTRIEDFVAWPFWNPDGKRIGYASKNPGSRNDVGDGVASSVPADGSGGPETLIGNEPGVIPAAWTPDGKGLLYLQSRTGGSQEFRLLPMSGDRKPELVLKSTGFRIWYPEFSPDGRWLAYASTESGKNQVYVQSFPISGEKRLVSNDFGVAPVWSRNGRELFYMGFDAKTKMLQVWAVDIQTGGAIFKFGTPHLLFDGDFTGSSPLRNYDVTSDGQRFLMVQRVESTDKPVTRLVLVQNWFDELRRRVPSGR